MSHNPSVAPAEFTQALACAANSVNLVTTDGPGGKAGLTVSSMCSVCAEPPVVLVCINQDNEFCTAIKSNQVFAVNLLSTEQTDLALVFAGHAENPDQDRFLNGSWNTMITGAPSLNSALVTLDCELTAAFPQGTHMIYTGRVVAVCNTDQSPLVYCNRVFSQSSPIL
ncbi:MAG: flavin reductase family protein [Granulosicoccus sp.]|nr:flavin reductase family protein [Granulosicoccus sp.]